MLTRRSGRIGTSWRPVRSRRSSWDRGRDEAAPSTVETTIRQSVAGTRMAGFVLTRQVPVGKWGKTTYALKKTAEEGDHRGHRGHRGAPQSDDANDASHHAGSDGPKTPMTPMPSASALLNWRGRV